MAFVRRRLVSLAIILVEMCSMGFQTPFGQDTQMEGMTNKYGLGTIFYC